MAEKIRKFINDYPAARWGALILIASMMFFAYMFVDVMSPLKSMIESERDGRARYSAHMPHQSISSTSAASLSSPESYSIRWE
jgi:hypothetical protein